MVSQIKTVKRCCRAEHRGTSGSRSNCRPESTTSVASGANTKTVARCAIASWSILDFPLAPGARLQQGTEFDWDPAKVASNLRKHRVSFDDAATVLRDNLLLCVLDGEHGGFEERRVSLGRSSEGQLVVVVHTYLERNDATLVRIISARPATPRERRRYEMGP